MNYQLSKLWIVQTMMAALVELLTKFMIMLKVLQSSIWDLTLSQVHLDHVTLILLKE
jgi:hypothetical protein